ncbi:isochorismatase family cysteine hydrolase [Amycolatopsis sp. A1MSW2902]|uniref:isochorismatase family cysteine hydrolase n=1 Tax=Amycolatopsis sp. A1MSW2902 TaxID=687413 RepID=UPI00307EAEDB
MVDLQEDFVRPDGPMREPEAYRQLPRVQALIEACRAGRVPVLYTEHTIAPDVAHDFYAFWPPIANGAIAEGTPGARLYRGLKPRADERVISAKHTYNSFAGTDLDYALRCQGVRTSTRPTTPKRTAPPSAPFGAGSAGSWTTKRSSRP